MIDSDRLAEDAKYSSLYAGKYGTGPVQTLLRISKRALDFEDKAIIDFGCGRATLRNQVSYKTYAGVDISSFIIDQNKKQNRDPKVSFLHSALDGLPYSDSQFDIGFCCDVMEHIEEKYVRATIREILRVCKIATFSISLRESSIRKDLHPTVKPTNWWLEMFTQETQHIMVLGDSHTSLYLMAAKKQEDLEIAREVSAVSVPYAIEGMRLRDMGDGTIFLPRHHKAAEEWLDNHFTRMGGGELRWYVDARGDWPSLEPLEKMVKDKEIYVVGKGPTLDKLEVSDFDNQDAVVVCINESIHTIKKLHLPNQIIGVQYDGELGAKCWVGDPMIISNRCAPAYTGKPNVFIVRERKYGTLSATMAIGVLKDLGADRFTLMAFDAATNGSLEYADSIGYSSAKSGSPDRFKGHKRRIIDAIGNTPFRWFIKEEADETPASKEEDDLDNPKTSDPLPPVSDIPEPLHEHHQSPDEP